MTPPILIVEDDPLQRQMLATLLRRKMDFTSLSAENGRAALDILESAEADSIKLIIMDLDMPVMGGMEALEILKQQYPSIPVIMLTGSRDIEDAIAAMKAGACDFVTKPYEGDRIAITVRNALKISILSKEVLRLKNEKRGTFSFENLIGFDRGLSNEVATGRKAAASDIPILITGETGTGKEVFAQAIHGESSRAGKPFIAVNCGAIPTQLVESTLFGHEKGAFTGATEKVIGKFREAEGGTIFLDEVGELPHDTQVKLLRVLQQKEVEPVGAGKPLPINVRIISATNRDLQNEVNDGNFREDLFFRLNVLQIELPPLRHRSSDIPALANHFIERFCSNENAIPKSIPQDVMKDLIADHWPGNVRQLENAINRSMVMSEGAALLFKESEADRIKIRDVESIAGAPFISLMDEDGNFKTTKMIEHEAIQIVLKELNGNITKAAKALGMAKSTFYKKIRPVSR